MNRAKFAAVVLLALGFGLGWFAINVFHNERFAVLEEQFRFAGEKDVQAGWRGWLATPSIPLLVVAVLLIVLVVLIILSLSAGPVSRNHRPQVAAQDAIDLETDVRHPVFATRDQLADLAGKGVVPANWWILWQGLGLERTQAAENYARCRREFALARLHWFATSNNVRVTIRFADTGDLWLVKEIQDVLKSQTNWPIDIDGSNNPVLLPRGDLKVVFLFNPTKALHDIGGAFYSGELVDAKVGNDSYSRSNTVKEIDHCVIEVLPAQRKD